MGTRADFYIGRSKNAEWIGSIAFDGYPSGNPKPLLNITNEAEYRAKVADLLNDKDTCATKPEQGWPWPWDDSATSDYAYAFDDGRVWATRGASWWPAEAGEPDEETGQRCEFPDMSARKNVSLERSGMIFLRARR